MPSFGTQSKQRLATCHPDLQAVMNEVIKYADITIICGHRSKEAQDEAYFSNKSKVKWPDSRHNSTPSMAVDAAPYPINWNDVHAFSHMAGRVLQIADQLLEQGVITHRVVSGIDWNRDGRTIDTKFFDAPHFQLEVVT